MSQFLYLTHPQVIIDPDVPVPEWSLAPMGRERVRALVESDVLDDVSVIYTSDETKALQTAAPLAEACDARIMIRRDLGENDRSATGYVPQDQFEDLAFQFFQHPDQSIAGWERARDAQTRVVAAVKAALAEAPDDTVLFIGHGGVGTLLYCAFANVAIDRRHDQGPGGGGNFITYDRKTLAPQHGWKPMESLHRALTFFGESGADA